MKKRRFKGKRKGLMKVEWNEIRSEGKQITLKEGGSEGRSKGMKERENKNIKERKNKGPKEVLKERRTE